MLIKPGQIKRTETLVKENNLRKKIKKVQRKDKKVVKAVKELKKAEIKILRNEKQMVEEELVMKKEQIYVLEGKLRKKVIHLYYNTPVRGYRGRWKTIELVIRNYWWPGVTKKVGRYIEKYNACQCYKNRSKTPVGKLISNVIPEKLQSHISADFITKLSLIKGYCKRIPQEHAQ